MANGYMVYPTQLAANDFFFFSKYKIIENFQNDEFSMITKKILKKWIRKDESQKLKYAMVHIGIGAERLIPNRHQYLKEYEEHIF